MTSCCISHETRERPNSSFWLFSPSKGASWVPPRETDFLYRASWLALLRFRVFYVSRRFCEGSGQIVCLLSTCWSRMQQVKPSLTFPFYLLHILCLAKELQWRANKAGVFFRGRSGLRKLWGLTDFRMPSPYLFLSNGTMGTDIPIFRILRLIRSFCLCPTDECKSQLSLLRNLSGSLAGYR